MRRSRARNFYGRSQRLKKRMKDAEDDVEQDSMQNNTSNHAKSNKIHEEGEEIEVAVDANETRASTRKLKSRSSQEWSTQFTSDVKDENVEVDTPEDEVEHVLGLQEVGSNEKGCFQVKQEPAEDDNAYYQSNCYEISSDLVGQVKIENFDEYLQEEVFQIVHLGEEGSTIKESYGQEGTEEDCQVKNEPVEDDLYEEEACNLLDGDTATYTTETAKGFIIIIKEEQENNVDETATNEDFFGHNGDIGNHQFECPHCPKTFRYRSSLAKHMPTHPTENPFKCTECPKTYRTQTDLDSHILTHNDERPFKCTYCSDTFTSPQILSRHIGSHTGQNPFRCPKCPQIFASRYDREVHKFSHLPFGCSFCPKAFKNRNTLKAHVKTHLEDTSASCFEPKEDPLECAETYEAKSDRDPPKPSDQQASSFELQIPSQLTENKFMCLKCPKTYGTKSAFDAHELSHKASNPTKNTKACDTTDTNELSDNPLSSSDELIPLQRTEHSFQCPKCPEICESKSALHNHKLCHKGERPFKCTHCSSSFKTIRTLKKHRAKHRGQKSFPCDECPESYSTSEELQNHNITHAPFACSLCEMSFKNTYGLRNHVSTHSSEKSDDSLHQPRPNHPDSQPFKCRECPEIFKTKSTFDAHVLSHKGKRAFKCAYCSDTFTSVYTLEKHIGVHTGREQFPCSHCSKSFISRNGLRKHIFSHTGERPFECTFCPKTFTSSSSLKSHIRTHTGEKPYSCTVCEKVFAEPKYLQKHMRCHTGERPYKCPHCPGSFKQRTNLSIHIRSHTGDRRYKCTECPSAFTIKAILDTHMMIHTGERPFHCPQCPKTFRYKSNFVSHQRSHTKKSKIESTQN
ncbi:hypothetical protein KR009_011990 [Drosophila setifemur]|nr:hypothetical protein KR009_011990 [Drosophila setifemur]